MPTAARADTVRCSQQTSPDIRVVLFVTTDSDLPEVAGRLLDPAKYRVLSAAHSGHAVLACIRAGRLDVAVIEMSMADVSGPALAERLRRRNPNLRVIYLSQPGTPESEGVLVRPFTHDDLLAKLTLNLAG